ncbi:MAG: shikimate kinase [Desulfurococcales archaeon]|jgi:shikimate kinase|nr:shikimate kinase [Desulfurococcales archaeon]
MWGFAGVSIVNAIPSWLGSTMAINIVVEVEIEEGSGAHSSLTRTIVEYFREKIGVPELRVTVRSPLPPESGLKTSSAVAVALIEAVKMKYGLRDIDTPKLAADLSIRAGVSITGAYDDATAAYHGGISLTNNKERRIIGLRDPPEDVVTVILVRGGRPKIDLGSLKRYENLFTEIFRIALKGDIITAMRLNGIAVAEILGYETGLIKKALELGALAAGVSGNGPSIFALAKRNEEGPIVDLFLNAGKTVVAEPVKIVRM